MCGALYPFIRAIGGRCGVKEASMNTRIALSFALLAACSSDSDIETGTDPEEARWGESQAAYLAAPIVDKLGAPECGNGVVAAPDVEQIELRWLATACHEDNEMVFRIQGREVVRTEAGAPCTCLPGVRSVRLTDPEVLKMIFGAVDFEAGTSATTLLAWAEVTVLDRNGAHTFTLFDQDGSAAGAEESNLCAAGSMEGASGRVRVELGEQCDDGNNRDGDGCSATCRLED
jgi:cysteine-rich repeat protein